MNFEIVILPHAFGMKNPSDLIFVPLMVDSLLRCNKNSKITFLNPNEFLINISPVKEFSYKDSEVDGVTELTGSYVHLSTNARDFELFCIKRFFVLRHYMMIKKIQSCFVVETDLLFFDSFKSLPNYFTENSSVFLSDHKCISTAFISIDFLNSFCNGVINFYKNNEYIKKLTNWFDNYSKSGGRGGICDMTFCDYIRRGQYDFDQIKIEDFSKIYTIAGALASFDSFIGRTSHTGCSGTFLMEQSPYDKKTIKKIIFRDGLAYAYLDDFTAVRMGSLHFQGSAKSLMGNYYTRWLKSVCV